VLILILIVAAGVGGYFYGRRRIVAQMPEGPFAVRSQPSFHASFVAAWTVLPILLVTALYLTWGQGQIAKQIDAGLPAAVQEMQPGTKSLFVNDASRHLEGEQILREVTPLVEQTSAVISDVQSSWQIYYLVVAIIAGLLGLFISSRFVKPSFGARESTETMVYTVLIIFASIAVFTTFGIVMSLIFESMRFFSMVSFWDFLTGTHWSPMTAPHADLSDADFSGTFGAVPIFTGTLLITVIAMIVAAPIGLLAAIYLSEFASNKVRATAKPLLEILAGIPTVVYGFFAALTVAPLVKDIGMGVGLDTDAGSALAAGIVMGMMIIPLVSSLSDDVINAVPQSLRDAAYGMGATHSETVRQVILPAALPGIVGAMLLAVSRAIGETMIVVMATGTLANLTANPLEMVTTVTVQIVTLLVGDQEFDSPQTLSAFALGMVLFVITLGLNVIALRVVEKYREQYD